MRLCDVLSRGSDAFSYRKMSQIVTNFLDSHIFRVPLFVKKNKISNVINIRFLGLMAEAARFYQIPDLIE